jgi:hypothetical protein
VLMVIDQLTSVVALLAMVALAGHAPDWTVRGRLCPRAEVSNLAIAVPETNPASGVRPRRHEPPRRSETLSARPAAHGSYRDTRSHASSVGTHPRAT